MPAARWENQQDVGESNPRSLSAGWGIVNHRASMRVPMETNLGSHGEAYPHTKEIPISNLNK